MIGDLIERVQPSGRGRLLDLACGTGQITFAVSGQFAELWAVDQEPDMIDAVRDKAAAANASHVRAVLSAAETVAAPASAFELVAVGNAFHRLRREAVAAKTFQWLQPDRVIALLWSSGPWVGDQDWQRAMSTVMDGWRTRLGVQGRAPAGWDRARQQRPDMSVLAEAGFQPVGSFPFSHRPRLDSRRADRIRVLNVGIAARRPGRPRRCVRGPAPCGTAQSCNRRQAASDNRLRLRARSQTEIA